MKKNYAADYYDSDENFGMNMYENIDESRTCITHHRRPPCQFYPLSDLPTRVLPLLPTEFKTA